MIVVPVCARLAERRRPCRPGCTRRRPRRRRSRRRRRRRRRSGRRSPSRHGGCRRGAATGSCDAHRDARDRGAGSAPAGIAVDGDEDGEGAVEVGAPPNARGSTPGSCARRHPRRLAERDGAGPDLALDPAPGTSRTSRGALRSPTPRSRAARTIGRRQHVRRHLVERCRQAQQLGLGGSPLSRPRRRRTADRPSACPSCRTE